MVNGIMGPWYMIHDVPQSVEHNVLNEICGLNIYVQYQSVGHDVLHKPYKINSYVLHRQLGSFLRWIGCYHQDGCYYHNCFAITKLLHAQ